MQTCAVNAAQQVLDTTRKWLLQWVKTNDKMATMRVGFNFTTQGVPTKC